MTRIEEEKKTVQQRGFVEIFSKINEIF